MYNWYSGAGICYAYLSDIFSRFSVRDPGWDGVFDAKRVFRRSRWFSRGWTLQELIAPSTVEFYASDWTEIGTKSELQQEISNITDISMRVLGGDDPSTCNVAERMSWAAFRNTTRVEDMAYCLLGIFKVYMPLLYGERERSFIRLQQEIMKMSEDFTLLAWPNQGTRELLHGSEKLSAYQGILATSVAEFRTGIDFDQKYSDLRPSNPFRSKYDGQKSEYEASPLLETTPVLTSRGLRLHIPLLQDPVSGIYSAFLHCRMWPGESLVCISLVNPDSSSDSSMMKVLHDGGLHLVQPWKLQYFKPSTICIRQEYERLHYQLTDQIRSDQSATFFIESRGLKECELIRVNPPPRWYRDGADANLQPGQPGSVQLRWGTTDMFTVRFGFHENIPWCEILLEPDFLKEKYEHSNSNSAFDFKRYRGSTDRASMRFRSGLACVRVAVRPNASPGRCYLLQVSIC
jgi:hypothetical protein